ncbi:MAG TPA: class I SAM-dependent methyltransferase [Solirubrobacteraceae bacterium]
MAVLRLMTADAPDPPAPTFAGASVSDNYARWLAPVIFTPWAEVLIERVGVRAGDQVLDVASGTGVVARLASAHATETGRVVASDVSATMLARAAAHPVAHGGAPIEYVQASVEALPVPDATFDIVLCQQGLQFFGDRAAAVRELRRVLRPGGSAGVAVWADGFRLEPFDDYAEAAVTAGLQPPFPGAFENATFVMGADEVRMLFDGAGFSTVEVATVKLTTVWPDAESAVAGILGTPFGLIVEALPADRRDRLDADLHHRFGTAAPIRRTTAAVVARARAPGA